MDINADQNVEQNTDRKKSKLIAVCGNIGSGKSTFIKRFLIANPEYQEMPECLDIWKPYFKPYYESLEKAKISLTSFNFSWSLL